MEDQEVIKKASTLRDDIKDLTGIEDDLHPLDYGHYQALLIGLHNPPTYFVYMLMKLTGFTCYGGADKSMWEVYVTYKNMSFCIRDHKASTWSIDGGRPSGEPEKLKKVAEELRRRIEKAGKKLDRILDPSLNRLIEQNEYYLLNSYYQLRTLYDYYFEQTEDSLRQANETSESATKYLTSQPANQNVQDIQHTFNEWASMQNRATKLERIAGYHANSMVSFFFSYTELLIDITFILLMHEPVRNPWKEFRTKSWDERFTKAFPIANDPTLARIYEKLLEIRGNWRNVLIHGFRDEMAYLVPIPQVGLIPKSYINTAKATHLFSSWPSPEKIREVLSIFASFDAWVQTSNQALYALLYAQSGLAIPLEQNRLSEIRGWMITPEKFDENIERELNRQQVILDQYQ